MKYSYNWLKEISGVELSAEEVVEKITMHSLEVEGVEKIYRNFDGVIVGKILEISKHPNADRLQVTKVDIGKEELQIVCGAHNISVGDKVPVALVGTKLPGGLEIKEAEIRGVASFGMLCAEDELELGSDHSGILILDESLEIGSSITEIFGEDDQILEIKVLPDRAHDAVSHVGLGREVAALSGSAIEYDYDGLVLAKKKTSQITVSIENKNLCSRYIAAKLDNVTVGKSPQWIKNRLEKCGIRSINNVVDVTNYVMLEIGQPMHAFDFDEIKNSKSGKVEISVKSAQENTELYLLDESKKELSTQDIVIANHDSVLALAGVMGGKNSGVSEKTTSIILESATFDATSIRKTKNKYNLQTDAAMRFEKSLDPNIAEKAMVRAIELLTHLMPAKLEGIVDAYPEKLKAWEIKLDLEYVDSLLGEKISPTTTKKILTSLGFKVKGSGKSLNVTVPTFRLDVLSQEDLIEEIGRVNGYDKIAPLPQVAQVKPAVIDEKRNFVRKIKSVLIGKGFSEVYNYAFYSKRDAEIMGFDEKHLELEAPMNPDQALLRISLIPNLLKNVRENLKQSKDLQFFEIGKIFVASSEILPVEKNILASVMVVNEKEGNKKNILDAIFFKAKSEADYFFHSLGINGLKYDLIPDGTAVWHGGRSADISIEGKKIGRIGEINPMALKEFDINSRVVVLEVDVDELKSVLSAEKKFHPIQKFPSITRDIALIVKKETKLEDVMNVIEKSGEGMVSSVELFDIFQLNEVESSYAFHLLLSTEDRTLTNDEGDSIIAKIIEKLQQELGVTLRS